MQALSKRQRYERAAAGLKLERTSFETSWRDVANKLFPMRPRFAVTDRNRGERKNQEIVDSTATFASNTLRSGLHAGLTSPSRPWFRLTTPNPDLAKFKPVAKYLRDVEQRMFSIFQLSNLYKVLPSLYGDMGNFGTAACGILDDPGDRARPGDLFRLYPYPIGSYWVSRDSRDQPCTFMREYAKTVYQLVEEYGGQDGQPLERGQSPNLQQFSLRVQQAWRDGRYEEIVEVCWLVTPNVDYDESRLDYRRFPWASCHFEKGQAQQGEPDVLRESGFPEFPVIVPTWERSAEDIYGTECPGMTALGDIRQLQVAQKKKAQAIEKQINPPLQAPHSARTQKVSLVPGDVTYTENGQGLQGIRPIHEVKPDIQYMVADIQEVQYRIHQAYHVDVFRMISMLDARGGTQPVTAEEIRAREQEKMMQLGPILEQSTEELIDPLIDRVFAMMGRAGLLPEPPPDIVGVDTIVESISILAQAQKMTEVAPLDGYLMRVGALAQTHPEVRHKVNPFEVANTYAAAFGIDPKLQRTDEEAQAGAEQDAQAAQAAAMAEQAQKMGAGVKSLGTTPMDGDTALTRLEGAA